jgi:hypothetical protein
MNAQFDYTNGYFTLANQWLYLAGVQGKQYQKWQQPMMTWCSKRF